jgi:cytochrome c553
VAVLQASRPPKAPSTQTFTFQTQVDSNGQVSVTPQQGGNYQAQGGQQQPQGDGGLGAIINAKCAACHNPQKSEGGLDFSAMASKSPQEQAETLWECYKRVTSNDPAVRMPKDAAALTPEETIVFAYASGSVGGGQAPAQ